MLDGRVPFSRNVVYRDERFVRVMYDTLRQFPLHNMPLRRVKVPVLVLAGDSDDIIPRDSVSEFAREIGARIRFYSGTHSLPLKKPKTVTSAVHEFFSEP
jgi:pimeloyl-ACP methyl ester carboxylesterase